MQHLYTTPATRPARRGLGRLLGLCALALGLQLPAQAQLVYNQYTSENVAGTYTDLGSAGTAIATANTDDANSTAQDIGFSFQYNGQNFTQFVLNTNGYLRLGSAAPSTTYFFSDPDNSEGGPLDSENAADVNLLLPFNEDLTAGTSPTEYRVATTGTAPNRVCTIQWKNVSDKARGGKASQFANLSFQVKLYETSNTIEFVYGPATGGSTPVPFKTVAIGIKGNNAAGSNTAADVLALYKEASTPWAQAQFVREITYFDIVNTVVPAAGRTFRFNTPKANDAAVASVFTYGQISAQATPHVPQALILNTGTTPLASVPVTLTVSGATTFTATSTVTNLSAGEAALVTFASYPVPTTGTNNLIVSIGNDAINGNNQQSVSQVITTNTLGYQTPNQALEAAFPNAGANSAIAAKYRINQSTTVSQVKLNFVRADVAYPYQVVLYDTLGVDGGPGNVLYTSTTQTRPTVAGPVTVTIPNTVVNSSFFVAVRATQGPLGLGAQIENLIVRPNTFYLIAPAVDLSAWTPLEETILDYLRPAVDVVFGAVPPCQTPVNFRFANITTSSANLTFTPSAGTGPYVAEYGPVGFTPGSGTTVASATSPIPLTGLATATTYDVYISKNCGGTAGTSARYGPLKLTTACQSGPGRIPYAETFDQLATLPCNISVLDANRDGFTWRLVGVTGASNSILYEYNSTNTSIGADDWIFTRALPLVAGQPYTAGFRYFVSSTNNVVYPQGLEIKYGTAPNPTAMTNTVYSNTNLTATNYTNQTSQPIVPTTSGQYYIGFHAISAPNSYYLILDDLTVTGQATLPVNQALSRVIEAYPNPTTGLMRLNLSASNARQRSATVFNTLGQVVLTRPLNMAAEQQLDLSTLSNGLYTVQLQLDNDLVVKRVSVQK